MFIIISIVTSKYYNVILCPMFIMISIVTSKYYNVILCPMFIKHFIHSNNKSISAFIVFSLFVGFHFKDEILSFWILHNWKFAFQ